MLNKSSAEINHISSIVIDAAFTVHRELGPGLLESVYHHCLLKELHLRSLIASTQVPVPLNYKGHSLNKEFVIDFIVEDEIILELKAVESLLPVHEAQLLTYLKLTNRRLGFLINFNVPLLKQGIKRMVNKL